MEFLSSMVLSGILYDMLKHRVSLSSEAIKTKLKDWIVDSVIASALTNEISKLDLTSYSQ